MGFHCSTSMALGYALEGIPYFFDQMLWLLFMVPARRRVKVALHHITLPQVTLHIARLRTRLKLGQEDKTKVFVAF